MKHATLIAAAGLIVLANAIALVHAARNRSGEPDAEIVLSDRELSYYDDPDDSGVSLTLHWLDPDSMSYSTMLDSEAPARPWLDAAKLAELGFDVSVDPADERANRFYSRQSARTGFVALEYDGPAWQAWADARRRLEEARLKPGATSLGAAASTAKAPSGTAPTTVAAAADVERELSSSSRLVLIDAGSDSEVLRSRHPNRHKVVIAPAVIGIHVRSGSAALEGQAEKPALLTGNVRQIPAAVHVPKPFSAGFRDRDRTIGSPERYEAQYFVHLRYGRLLEPWVTGVELDPQHAPR